MRWEKNSVVDLLYLRFEAKYENFLLNKKNPKYRKKMSLLKLDFFLGIYHCRPI